MGMVFFWRIWAMNSSPVRPGHQIQRRRSLLFIVRPHGAASLPKNRAAAFSPSLGMAETACCAQESSLIHQDALQISFYFTPSRNQPGSGSGSTTAGLVGHIGLCPAGAPTGFLTYFLCSHDLQPSPAWEGGRRYSPPPNGLWRSASPPPARGSRGAVDLLVWRPNVALVGQLGGELIVLAVVFATPRCTVPAEGELRGHRSPRLPLRRRLAPAGSGLHQPPDGSPGDPLPLRQGVFQDAVQMLSAPRPFSGGW